tara:strand:+ start:292 stop:564 length:273 start_codon:yes stop_codon:yes gene_type:complete
MKKGVNNMKKYKDKAGWTIIDETVDIVNETVDEHLNAYNHLVNEKLLDREEDIRVLNKKISTLRLALLKIQATDFDNLHENLIKKALSYE